MSGSMFFLEEERSSGRGSVVESTPRVALRETDDFFPPHASFAGAALPCIIFLHLIDSF